MNAWKARIRFPVDYPAARRCLKAGGEDRDLTGRPVVLDLRTDHFLIDGARHLTALAHHASAAGSKLHLRCDRITLGAIARKTHGRKFLRHRAVDYLPPDQLMRSARVFSDLPGKGTFLRMTRDADSGVPAMPYPMHPATLAHADNSRLSLLRNVDRSWRIFFAGNQKARYADGRIERGFAMMNRLEILRIVREVFAKRVVEQIDRVGRDSIVLTDSRVEPIAAENWLPTIARSDFFLCCPGNSQPVCHNLIEAMAVGTIPIVPYGDRLTPPLVDGETAITFSSPTDLIAAVRRAIAMPADRRAAMRAAVIDHYGDHLDGASFFAQIRDDETIREVCMPFHHQIFSTQGRAA